MNSNNSGLHPLIHVSKEPGVGWNMDEDHVSWISEDEAEHLQTSAHSIDQSQMVRRHCPYTPGDSPGHEVRCSGQKVWSTIETIVVLPLPPVFKHIRLSQPLLNQILHQSIDSSAQVDHTSWVPDLVILVTFTLQHAFQQKLWFIPQEHLSS